MSERTENLDEEFVVQKSKTDLLHEYYIKTEPSKLILGAFIPSITQNILATFSFMLSYSIQTLYFGDQTIYSYASFMPIWFIFATSIPCSAAEITAITYANLIGDCSSTEEFQQFFARSIWIMIFSGLLGSFLSLTMSIIVFRQLLGPSLYKLFYFIWSFLYPIFSAFSFGPNFWFRTENRKFLIFCRFSYQFITQLLIEYSLYYFFQPTTPWPSLVALILSFSMTTIWSIFLIREKTLLSILIRSVVKFDLTKCKALFVPETFFIEFKAIFRPFLNIFVRFLGQIGESAAVLICLYKASQYEDKFYQFATYLDLTLYYMFGAFFKIVGNTLYQVILTPMHVNFQNKQYNRTLDIVKRAVVWYIILTVVIAIIFYLIFVPLTSFLTFNQDDQQHQLTFLYFRDYTEHLKIIALVTTVSNSLEGIIMTAMAFSTLENNFIYAISLPVIRISIALYGSDQIIKQVAEFAQFGYVLLFANCATAVNGLFWVVAYFVKFKLVWKEKRHMHKTSIEDDMRKISDSD